MKCFGRKTKFLVFGGETGWIGQKLVKLLQTFDQLYSVHATNVRMEQRETVERLLDNLKPNRVLVASGVTGRPNVDWCESHKADTVLANVVGTLSVLDACQRRGIHVTLFATGCIYEYDDDKHALGNGVGFVESDKPNFDASFYSMSKALCERLIREAYNDNVLTLRLRMPISDDLNSRSFVTKITKYERVVDVPNSMSVLSELLPVSLDMSLRKRTGVYNFCNPGVISHNEVLEIYKQIIDPKFTWKNFSLDEQSKILAAGRSNNHLDVTKLTNEYDSSIIQNIHTAVRDALLRGREKVVSNKHKETNKTALILDIYTIEHASMKFELNPGPIQEEYVHVLFSGDSSPARAPFKLLKENWEVVSEI